MKTKMIRRVMLDIEGLGTRVGSVFFAVAAVEFTGGVLGREFSALIDPRDAQSRGLTIDADTVGWWMQQSPEARAEAGRAWEEGLPLPVGLEALRGWLEEMRAEGVDGFEVWGNAPGLDCALVEEGYRVCGVSGPWEFWQERCYRTLKKLRPEIGMERAGTHHRALDDARDQARHAIRLLEECADWQKATPKCERCGGSGLCDHRPKWGSPDGEPPEGGTPTVPNAEAFLAATQALWDGEALAEAGDLRDEGARVVELLPGGPAI